jgi:hypothetical protein
MKRRDFVLSHGLSFPQLLPCHAVWPFLVFLSSPPKAIGFSAGLQDVSSVGNTIQ